MRRSLLFIPGNNPAMLQNADVFESDAVIFDLEDAVSITEKDSARNLVGLFLKSTKKLTTEVVVRINGLDTNYYLDDLNAIVSDNIDTIMLPKARVSDLKKLDKILTNLESARNIEKHIAIIPIIELSISVLEINEIARCNRVNGILLGAEDLSSDLEVTRTKEGTEILYPRYQVIYACNAYKIDAIDTPFTDTLDQAGLLKDASFAKSIGMTAKAAIHPNQVPVINSVFVPTAKQIDYALRVEVAAKKALEQGLGVFSLDGKMVDKPVIERAKKVLAKARKYNLI